MSSLPSGATLYYAKKCGNVINLAFYTGILSTINAGASIYFDNFLSTYLPFSTAIGIVGAGTLSQSFKDIVVSINSSGRLAIGNANASAVASSQFVIEFIFITND